jgi:hypothetical protein
MKKTNLLAFSISALALAAGATLIACGDDTTGVNSPDGAASGTSGTSTGTSGTTGTTGTSGSKADAGPDATVDSGPTPDAGPDATLDGGDAAIDASDAAVFPAPPTLGIEIDRFGRPAVNTALDHTFDNSDGGAKGAAKDAYNANSDAGSWVAAYTAEFEKNLAIYDSLDTTADASGCGNQIFASPAADAGPSRYSKLASVLADDRMWINTGSANCTQYLGVELVATGVLKAADGGPADQCGGRTPGEDVIDTTYSAVAAGALSGVTDGVSANVAKTTVTSFPYFQVISQ